jgi:protein involved in polysaccharide export with SLBB domain
MNMFRGLLAFLLFSLAACSSNPPPVAAAPDPVVASAPYALGAGDKLRITVFGEDRLSGEYSVTGTGNLSFPLIGNVPVQGRSLEQVQGAIRDALAAGYLKDPRVSVEVLNYRPYYILGEVAKPGEYPYVTALTVGQAIATAGGYTYRANTRRIYIKRVMDTREQQYNLRADTPIPVQPGDTIRVAERFF